MSHLLIHLSSTFQEPALDKCESEDDQRQDEGQGRGVSHVNGSVFPQGLSENQVNRGQRRVKRAALSDCTEPLCDHPGGSAERGQFRMKEGCAQLSKCVVVFGWWWVTHAAGSGSISPDDGPAEQFDQSLSPTAAFTNFTLEAPCEFALQTLRLASSLLAI